MQRDFREALKQADEALSGQRMSPETDRRLRERLGLSDAKRSFSWRWLPAGALAAACAALLVVALRPAPRAPELGGFALQDTSGDFEIALNDDRSVAVKGGQGTLVDAAEGVSLAVLSPGAVRKEQGGVRVVSGSFATAVVKRARGAAPCRVLVSHGAIEVLGTRFTVVQQAQGGKVTLHEGSIRFVADDGRTVLLAPGESLAWPLPAPAVTTPEPTPPAPTPEPEPAAVKPVPARPVAPAAASRPSEPEAERIEELLQRIDELRSRGQFDAAATQLEKALEAGYGEATRERLSFELGTILSRPGSDGQRACAHWREHAQRFAHGRYDREIEQSVRRLNCPGP